MVESLTGNTWTAAEKVADLLQRPADPWWDDRDTDGTERRDDILEQTLLEASDEIIRLLARNPSDWEWGRLHRLELRNQTLGTSGIGPVEALFNRLDNPIGGGGSLVNATTWNAAEGYAVTAAPSMRMVVSLADFDDSRWINLTGTSGHAFHANYTDQTDLFVAGRTLRWAFSKEAVEAAGENTLTFTP